MRPGTCAIFIRCLAISLTIASIPLFALGLQYNTAIRNNGSQSERERQLHDLELERKNPGKREDSRQVALSQLREDFSRLYAIQRGQLSPAITLASFDCRALATATEEIRERAARVKQNLLSMLSKRDEKRKKEYTVNENDLKASLTELNGLIVRFVNSPVFRVHSPDDNELRIQAREDLEGIIKLSDEINKVTRKMMKSALTNTAVN